MNIQEPRPSPDPDGDNPLQFWVAYIPGEGDKKNYLSNGKGNLRVFKSESALRKWLKPQLRPKVYEMVVVHTVQGNIALPDDGTFGKKPIFPFKHVPVGVSNLQSIRTLAPPTVPTAQEQLEELIKRRSRRRKH